MANSSLKGDEVYLKFNEQLIESMTNLNDLWQEIGYNEQMRETFQQQAYQHLKDLLQDMVEEIEQRKSILVRTIKDLIYEVNKVSTLLDTTEESQDILTGLQNSPLITVEEKLREYLSTLHQRKEERLQYFKELAEKEKVISQKLGLSPHKIYDIELPSEKDLDEFNQYIEQKQNEIIQMEAIFTDKRKAIINMMNNLGLSPSTHFENLLINSPDNLVFTNSNYDILRELYSQYEFQVQEAQLEATELRQELKKLWNRLEEPQNFCEQFLESHPGYCRSTLNSFKAEIKRCKAKHQENIGKYVEKIREEVVKMWDMCRFDEKQRNEFAAFKSNKYTEDLLTIHELELNRLQQYYDANRKIFENLNELENIWMKIQELDLRANDPDRFHNRGGQLLAEEKERKAVEKKLPKIVDEIQNLVNQYENVHGEPFNIDGVSFDEYVQLRQESYNEEKENIRKARKEAAKEKSAKKTPMSMSKRARIMSTSRHNTPAGSVKRKLILDASSQQSSKRRNITTNISEQSRKKILYTSKIRRSAGIIERRARGAKTPNKNDADSSKNLDSTNTTDTTYGRFQEHLQERNELRSSLIGEELLKIRTLKATPKVTPKTPIKPTRRHLGISTPLVTPKSTKLPRPDQRTPRSPRIISTRKLAAVPTSTPNIF